MLVLTLDLLVSILGLICLNQEVMGLDWGFDLGINHVDLALVGLDVGLVGLDLRLNVGLPCVALRLVAPDQEQQVLSVSTFA